SPRQYWLDGMGDLLWAFGCALLLILLLIVLGIIYSVLVVCYILFRQYIEDYQKEKKKTKTAQTMKGTAVCDGCSIHCPDPSSRKIRKIADPTVKKSSFST
ncbi:hypothetical protein PENTCL1PPCAC_20996, partial [Pristionchus entomophagus]